MPKLRYGTGEEFEKAERAAGLTEETPKNPPSTPPPSPATFEFKPTGKLRGKWMKPGKTLRINDLPEGGLLRSSTSGSPPMSEAELRQGYRKLGKGLEK